VYAPLLLVARAEKILVATWVAAARTVVVTSALFVRLISHQPAVLFSQNKSATSNQPTILFSQNKPAPAISHEANEQAAVHAR
jgi:hypothetical protein